MLLRYPLMDIKRLREKEIKYCIALLNRIVNDVLPRYYLTIVMVPVWLFFLLIKELMVNSSDTTVRKFGDSIDSSLYGWRDEAAPIARVTGLIIWILMILIISRSI